MRRRPSIVGRNIKILLIILVLATIGFGVFLYYLPHGKPDNLQTFALEARMPTPEEVRGIYITSFVAAIPDLRKDLIDMVEQTELNTVVIDLKDVQGQLAFQPKRDSFEKIEFSPMVINDLEAWIDDLHDKGIYTIARITVFQDSAVLDVHPEWAIRSAEGGIWQDWGGMAWVDPGCEEAWEYIADMSREAYDLGFDEINLDYIRFPSDGPTSKMVFYYHQEDEKRKYQTLSEFFSWIDSNLHYLSMPMSVDLFGLTYLKQNQEDDMNIGQRVTDAAEHFDYLMPMVYPSHYPSGFLGFTNPAEYPYEIIKESLVVGNEILESVGGNRGQTRPWIQDFNMGAEYTAEMVKEQIRAAREQGANGWIAWNARNIYTADAYR